MGSGSMYDNTPTSRFEEDMRAIIDGTPWPDRPPKSKMEILLKELYDSISDWKSKTKGAYVLHGSATLQTLPSDLTVDMVGWTYDMSEEFTTDSRFVEVGKKYPAGTNVSIANVGTDETPVLKYDVMSAFVDVDAIYNSIDKVANMVADEFDSASAYSIGDIVWYEDTLYTFTSAHTAGSAWSSLEVTQTTVEEVLTAAVSSINNALSDIESMIGTEFNAANPYSKGDYVIYQDNLYKFTANHTAGAAWNSSIVTAIDLTSAIKAVEADIATLSGYFADMSDDVEALEDQVEIMQEVVTKKKTATGNPLVIEDALESNADGLVAKIVPIQSGSGDPSPENIRPISGRTEVNLGRTGKNLYNNTAPASETTVYGVKFTPKGDGTIEVSGTPTGYAMITLSNFACNAAMGNVTFSIGEDVTNIVFDIIRLYNSSATMLGEIGNSVKTVSVNLAEYPTLAYATIAIKRSSNGVACSGVVKPQVEVGNVATPFEPYITPVTLTIALGTTVYGGNLNVKTGVLTITNVLQTFDGSDDESWGTLSGDNFYQFTMTISDAKDMLNFITNEFKRMDIYYRGQQTGAIYYNDKILRIALLPDMNITTVAEWRAWLAEHPLQIAYELATPTTIQLTGAELALLMGYNRVTSDSGDITLTYKANAVQDLQNEKADNADMVDYIENGNKASRAYSANQFMLWKGDLYKVTTSIASGATITAGTNVTKTTIGAVLTALLNA